MAQCDNNVIITGRVVKGPFVSYVNGDETKMRVKYQVSVFRRKKDTTQSFAPWVRTLGNQAKKDYDNIKVGDVVTVQGRIATRNETKKRYFILEDEELEKEYEKKVEELKLVGKTPSTLLDEFIIHNFLSTSDSPRLVEIDGDDTDLVEKIMDSGRLIFSFDDRKMVTEIQGDDVRYFSQWLADLDPEVTRRLVNDDRRLDEVIARSIKNQLVDKKEEGEEE